MQIFVKTITGKTIAIDVESNQTLRDVKEEVWRREGVPVDQQRMVFASRNLIDSQTLDEAGIQRESTLQTILNVCGGAPKKKTCSFKACSNAAQRIVGDCTFCDGHFCGKHRLLEDHKCTGLENCKKESHDRNAMKLNSERTVVGKV